MELSVITDTVLLMKNRKKTRHSMAVKSMRYKPKDKTLQVTFRNGGKYVYAGVTPQTWQTVRDADSHGTVVNSVVKPNHDFVRVN